MICPNCKGLGSIIKANPSSGEFEIRECSCKLKKQVYFCNDTGAKLEVSEVVQGVMSVLEDYDGKKLRRLINYSLFQQHLEEGVITKL